MKKAWQKELSVFSIFEHFEAVQTVLEVDEQFKKIGTYPCQEGLKMMFVENEFSNAYGIERFGSDVKNQIEEYLLSTILKNSEPMKYPKPQEAILNAVNKLRDKGIEPNVIIVGRELNCNREFETDGLMFVPNWRLKEEEKSKIGIGLFDAIPVVVSFSDRIKNQIIVANLNQAFDLEILENEDWIEKRLCVNVHEITHEEAIKTYEENPSQWTKDPDGDDVSFDEAINYICNYIKFEVFTMLKLQILDKKAFEISEFELKKRY